MISKGRTFWLIIFFLLSSVCCQPGRESSSHLNFIQIVYVWTLMHVDFNSMTNRRIFRQFLLIFKIILFITGSYNCRSIFWFKKLKIVLSFQIYDFIDQLRLTGCSLSVGKECIIPMYYIKLN